MINSEEYINALSIVKTYEKERKDMRELMERQRASDLRRKQLSCPHKNMCKWVYEKESDYRFITVIMIKCIECDSYLAEVDTNKGKKYIISDYDLVKEYRRKFSVIDSGDRV